MASARLILIRLSKVFMKYMENSREAGRKPCFLFVTCVF